MRRLLRFGLLALLVLLALLGVNAWILDKETKPAEVNAPGGKLTDSEAYELQYVDHPATGSGPEGEPIVLLHCYTCSLRWWDQMVPLLNENHRVITFDLLGHGGSEKPTGGYEIETQAAAIAEALSQQLGVTSATIVGHSMGGLVATSLAEQSSDLADRVVLIDVPAQSGDAHLPATAGMASWPVIGEALWRIKFSAMIKNAAKRSFAPGTDVSEVFPGQPNRVVDDVDAMTFKSFEESQAAADDFLDHGGVPSRLTATGVPTLVIMGTEDQILDTDEVLSQYEAIPGARLVPIDGAGHSPNVEEPQETADQILSFVGNAPLVTPPEGGGDGGGGQSDGSGGGQNDGDNDGADRGNGKGEDAGGNSDGGGKGGDQGGGGSGGANGGSGGESGE